MRKHKILWLGLGWIFFSSSVLWANKTDSINLMKLKEMTLLGSKTNLYITPSKRIVFAPRSKKVLNIDSEVVWSSYGDDKYLIFGTGNQGKVWVYDLKLKLKKEIELDSSDVFSITKDRKGNYYFGTGSSGVVYRVRDGFNQKPEVFLNLEQKGKDFIWDMLVWKDSLYLATGGDEGELFLVSLNEKNKLEDRQATSLFLSDSPNLTRLKRRGDQLYFSSDSSGKLYKMQLGTKESEVVFDGGEKDIADFIFQGDDIFLGTSGTELLTESYNTEKINDKYRNYVIKVNRFDQAEVMYSFEEKNISRLATFKKDEQGHRQVLIGLVEDMEIYRMILTDFPRMELLHFNKEVQLSSLVSRPDNKQHDKYYLTTANQGAVYEMVNDYVERAEVISKVIDFNQTVQWGKLDYEVYDGSDDQVKVSIRMGNTKKVDNHWSRWISEEERKNLKLFSRFLQVKVELKKAKSKARLKKSVEVGDLQLYFSYRNIPHRIVNLRLSEGMGNNPIEPSQDLVYGMLGSEHVGDGAMDFAKHGGSKDQPNNGLLPLDNYDIKDILTLSWDVINPDKDRLSYSIYYRDFLSINSSETGWVLLTKDYFNKNLYLNKRKFASGRYEFKVVASDKKINGKKGFLDEEVTSVVTIDNLPPTIEFTSELTANSKQVSFRVKDSLSMIKSVGYSFDRKNVYQLSPQDGVLDEQEEEFILSFPKSGESGKSQVEKMLRMILIIVEDMGGNYYYHYIKK